MKKTPFECTRETYTIRGFEFSDGKCSSNDKKPVAIISHGFMANQKTVKKYAEFFVKQGYIAYTFDFVGGCIRGLSDGSLDKDMTLLTEIEDLKTVINYVKNNSSDYADTDRITLMGCSQGGAVSSMVAVESDVKVEKLILFYPALCIQDDALKGQMIFYKFDPDNVPEKVHGFTNVYLNGEYIKVAQKLNIIERAMGYKGPVLIVHGTGDNIVNYEYSVNAFESYRNSREDSDDPDKGVFFYLIDKAKHGFKGLTDLKAKKYILDFITTK